MLAPSPTTSGGSRAARWFVTHHQHAVVTAHQIAFNQNVVAEAAGVVEPAITASRVDTLTVCPFALVAILWLDHDWAADFLGSQPGIFKALTTGAGLRVRAHRRRPAWFWSALCPNGFGYGPGGVHFSSLDAALLAPQPNCTRPSCVRRRKGMPLALAASTMSR